MGNVKCASVDCKHNDDQNRCRLNHITLSDHYVHTAYDDDVQHFWKCKMHERSEASKRLERLFLECMRKDGIDV